MQIQIGNKVIEVDRFIEIEGKQIPVIQTISEEICYPNGRIDVIVKVPCLQIQPILEE